MTTILADFRLGVMVADSSINDGDRVWSGRKVWRCKGSIIGFAGYISEAIVFLQWLKSGGTGTPPPFTHSEALVMNDKGLFHYDFTKVLQPVKSGREAIGTGAKSAMCAYEALGFFDPRTAVKIVCKHDSSSRAPVRIYRMKP